MPHRLALHFHELDATVELNPRRRTVLGVSETCDVDLRRYLPAQAIRTISRRHCEIAFIQGEGYLIADLNSLNGTRVNSQPLQPGSPRFLRDGDTVMLAENPDFLLRVVDDECHTELLVSLGKTTSRRGPTSTWRQGSFTSPRTGTLCWTTPASRTSI